MHFYLDATCEQYQKWKAENSENDAKYDDVFVLQYIYAVPIGPQLDLCVAH